MSVYCLVSIISNMVDAQEMQYSRIRPRESVAADRE